MVEDQSIHGTEAAMLKVPLGSAGVLRLKCAAGTVFLSRVSDIKSLIT